MRAAASPGGVRRLGRTRLPRPPAGPSFAKNGAILSLHTAMHDGWALGAGPPLLTACVVTGAAYVVAQYLARQRVDADAALVAEFAASAPQAPPPPVPHAPLRAAPRVDGVTSVQVYLPTLLAPREGAYLYGWHFAGGPGEYVVVIAGLAHATPNEGGARVARLGTYAPTAVPVRNTHGLDLHVTSDPAVAWYVGC